MPPDIDPAAVGVMRKRGEAVLCTIEFHDNELDCQTDPTEALSEALCWIMHARKGQLDLRHIATRAHERYRADLACAERSADR